MAVVVHTGRQFKQVSHASGEHLWESMLNPTGLSETQLEYLATVQDVYLDWHRAPDSYIEAKLDRLIPFILNDWLVTGQGVPTKPGTEAAWNFARKWGLWQNGRPTAIVQPYLVSNPLGGRR